MPSVLLEDSIALDLEAQEPWPQAITIYRPYEVEQILLPDSANCLAVQAFLKMCGLPFEVESKANAEYMSPTGKVPFIKCGAFLISEFENIVSFIGTKGISLSEHLPDTSKADMRAFMSLVNNVFLNAELYICWVDQSTFDRVTKTRYGHPYPWPLNHYLTWQKRREIIKKLNVLGWYNKTINEVCKEVEQCCIALCTRLEGGTFFSGDQPTELDALVYGHVDTLIKCEYPVSIQAICTTVKDFPLLVEHKCKMEYYINKTRTIFPDDYEVIDSPSTDTVWNCSESIESLPPLSEDSFVL